MSDLLDGIYRPHFFYGVATVVARLFLHAQPDVAVFGEKDYQQLQIIRRMVRDLAFPLKSLAANETRCRWPRPVVAQSLPVRRSTPDRLGAVRGPAPCLNAPVERGDPSEVLEEARGHVLTAGFKSVDYIALVDPGTLQALPAVQIPTGTKARLLGAAWLGRTRLIDNVSVTR